ncbi:MAG: Do family serine endopeptidase [Spirochaetales bacterium]|nr:Do family serine endopeptidase [Spirochaetales bacterium]
MKPFDNLDPKKLLIFNIVLVAVVVALSLTFMLAGTSSTAETEKTQQVQTAQEPAPDDSFESLENIENSFRDVADQVLPEVVTLKVVDVVQQQMPQQGFPWNLPQNNQNNGNNGQEYKRRGLGSGVIVKNDGDKHYILTNAHVVGDADEIQAVLNDGKQFTASLVGKDPRRDLALVQFTSDEDIPVAELGNSDKMQPGDWVLAVGSPFGFASSISAGIVSAKGRSGPQQTISQYIQTDAAINRGSSGGALVNLEGKVVGINTWIAAPSGGNVGLGFAVPINNAKQSITDIIEKGKVEYGWLGVTATNVNEKLAEKMKLDTQQGALVHNIYLDSPAAEGGLLPGDFITRINDQEISDRDELVRVIGNMRAGESADFTVYRYGEKKNISLSLGKREDRETIISNQDKLWPGMIVVPLQKETREKLNLEASVDGVLLVHLQKGSKPYIGGLRPSDVITKINETPVESLLDYYKAFNNTATSEFEIGFIRKGNEYSVEISK